jgi:hypothetical protein
MTTGSHESRDEHKVEMMNSDHQRFLMEFDEPQEVEIVCRVVWNKRMYWAVPGWVISASDHGWITPTDGLGPVDSRRPERGIYPRILMLTDKGREQLGLPIARSEQPKPKPKTLFD